MKPLVLWCRWHDATLRLHGRDDSAVWGELAFPQETESFHFDLQSRLLTTGEGDGQQERKLDEMGIEIEEKG